MKKRSGTVLLITAIILALIMAGVYIYAPVSFKATPHNHCTLDA